MSEVHEYRSSLRWNGSTGDGYEQYTRDHEVSAPPASAKLSLSSDPAFVGDPDRLNPEQLQVAAASSCQLLSFLAVAARARIDVVSYEDDADGVMPEENKPMWITRIVLRPKVTVRGDADEDRVRQLLEKAHDLCFIANSLRTEVVLEPEIEVAA